MWRGYSAPQLTQVPLGGHLARREVLFMASKTDIEIKIIGAGSSKFGLWLLGFVARMFHINLEVRSTNPLGRKL